ncbi:MAG: PLP-dependent aminotransferase family protein [Eubacteriaceae bacterium]|nr:PLP-dependent aminotransferase family protein [Eubacteriaceae bacterium]
MRYSIDKKSKKSAYMQIYEQLRRDIVGGIIPYNTKLPSKRLLAEETGVSVITVEHAYSILKDEGYVDAKERSGYFVIFRQGDLMASSSDSVQEYTPHKIHTQNNGEVFPYTVLAKTMRKVMLDYSEDILVKSLNHGCLELREAIGSYLARSSGIIVNPKQIIIGSGAEYLYSLIAQLFGTEGTFAIEDPSYNKIKLVYEANGITCDMLRMGNDGIRTEELEKTSAGILHITPFHSFPSGITATASKRTEYLRWAEKRDGFIIEDNYDSELTVSMKNEDTLFSMSSDGRVIYLNTFSKTIAPSMRVGYMVLPERLLDEFESKLGFYSCTVPVFEQYVLSELIKGGDFERHINRIRRERRRKK